MFFAWPPPAGAVPPTGDEETPVVLRISADDATLRRALGELSTPALEDAWTCTDYELTPSASLSRRSALIRMRGLILDEVEQRSARRYRAWLRRRGPHTRDGHSSSVVVN